MARKIIRPRFCAMATEALSEPLSNLHPVGGNSAAAVLVMFATHAVSPTGKDASMVAAVWPPAVVSITKSPPNTRGEEPP